MYTVEQFTKDNAKFISERTFQIREAVLETLQIQGFHQSTYSFDNDIPIGAIYIVLSKIETYFKELGWFAVSQKLDNEDVVFELTVRPR
ncbi:TPA: hypothetical protein ACGVAW_000557 [Vibrio vulnificus]